MNNYEYIASAIIKYQFQLMGQLAFVVASKIHGLEITSPATFKIKISKEPEKAIDELVSKCEFLWGRLGIETCKSATEKITITMKESDIPKSLR